MLTLCLKVGETRARRGSPGLAAVGRRRGDRVRDYHRSGWALRRRTDIASFRRTFLLHPHKPKHSARNGEVADSLERQDHAELLRRKRNVVVRKHIRYRLGSPLSFLVFQLPLWSPERARRSIKRHHKRHAYGGCV